MILKNILKQLATGLLIFMLMNASDIQTVMHWNFVKSATASERLTKTDTDKTPLENIRNKILNGKNPYSNFFRNSLKSRGTSFLWYSSDWFPAVSLVLLGFYIFLGRKNALNKNSSDNFEYGLYGFIAGVTIAVILAALTFKLRNSPWGINSTGLIFKIIFFVPLIAAVLTLRKIPDRLKSISVWLLALSGWGIILAGSIKNFAENISLTVSALLVTGIIAGMLFNSFNQKGLHSLNRFIFPSAGLFTGYILSILYFFHTGGISSTCTHASLLSGICGALSLTAIGKPKNYKSIRARSWPWPLTALSLFIITLLFVFFSTTGQKKHTETTLVNGENCLEKPFKHCLSMRENKKILQIDSGVFPETMKLRGYAGPIRMLLSFNEKGVIVKIKIGENKETPSFIRRITPWVDNFIGKGPSDDLFSGKSKIDTISGATMSTSTIRETVEISRKHVLNHLKLNYTGSSRPKHKTPHRRGLIIVSMLFISGFIAFTGLILPRILFLFLSLFILGVWLNWMISMVDMGLFFMNTLPAPFPRLLMVSGALILALAAGPLWCGYLCPMGALQEILRISVISIKRVLSGKRTDIFSADKKDDLNWKALRYASFIKYIILSAGIGLFVFTGNQKFTEWDPLSWFFSFDYNTIPRIISLVMIIGASLFIFRPHCRFICPVGAFFSLFNHIALAARKLPVRKIPSCDYGVKSASDTTCIRCHRCALHRKKH
ncbi:MAG: 4Fe-4S binding protein [Deltaproteobacteria bacterium]|nr:4Fe-4S binding protein [Deltaproteobacteria bacterium]